MNVLYFLFNYSYLSAVVQMCLQIKFFPIGIDYIKFLQNQSAKQKEQEFDLEKEVHALRIMKE